MKIQLLGGLGLAVLILSLGLVLPEANAGNNAVKELKKQQSIELKAYKAELKEQGLSRKDYKAQVKLFRLGQLQQLSALRGGNPGGGLPGGNSNNGGGNSVPIPGTLLPFAGAFAGLVYWRTRQP